MAEIWDETHHPGRRKDDKQPHTTVVHHWYRPIFKGPVYFGEAPPAHNEMHEDESGERPEDWR